MSGRLLLLASAFARLNILFQPNSFEVFGFVACLYWLVCYVQQERPRYLYLLGLGLGLGLLNKYTTLFFIAALGGALLLTPTRQMLLSRHLWGAAGLAALLWLPNLVWQIRQGLPFLHHMALLKESQLVHVEAADFWKAQLLMCLPATWAWLPGLVALLAFRAFRAYRVVGLVSVLGVGLLAALHGKDYYALGYYPVLFAFGAVWWEGRLVHFRRKTILQPVLVLIPLAFPAFFLPLLFPVRSPAEMADLRPQYAGLGVYRWEDGQEHALPQDYADMLGWRELADQTWAAYQSLPPAIRAHTLINCGNYGQASAINYYNRHRPLPPANSMNGSFLFWYPRLDSVQAVIIVDDEPDDELAPNFKGYSRFSQIANPYAREQGTSITIGLQPDSLVIAHVRNELKAAKAAWVVVQ